MDSEAEIRNFIAASVPTVAARLYVLECVVLRVMDEASLCSGIRQQQAEASSDAQPPSSRQSLDLQLLPAVALTSAPQQLKEAAASNRHRALSVVRSLLASMPRLWDVSEVSVLPGDILIQEGQGLSSVYVVLYGHGAVSASLPSAQQRCCYGVGPGDVLGEMHALLSVETSTTELAGRSPRSEKHDPAVSSQSSNATFTCRAVTMMKLLQCPASQVCSCTSCLAAPSPSQACTDIVKMSHHLNRRRCMHCRLKFSAYPLLNTSVHDDECTGPASERSHGDGDINSGLGWCRAPILLSADERTARWQ
jgi:Cyclic nucleotide-binding domain